MAKAYSGAVALKLVAEHVLSLETTVGDLLPGLPTAWNNVTLQELLNHTSGIPDFSNSADFLKALIASPFGPPPPAGIAFVCLPHGYGVHASGLRIPLLQLRQRAGCLDGGGGHRTSSTPRS